MIGWPDLLARAAAPEPEPETPRPRDWVSGGWQTRAGIAPRGKGAGKPRKLTTAQVLEIRRRGREGETGTALATEFECSPTYARRIIRAEVRSVDEE